MPGAVSFTIALVPSREFALATGGTAPPASQLMATRAAAHPSLDHRHGDPQALKVHDARGLIGAH